MNTYPLLAVAPVGWDGAELSAWSYYSLSFRFVDCLPVGGLVARRTGYSEQGETVDVHKQCEAFNGGFSQHALNRLFAQALRRCRPSVVVIIGLFGCTVDLPRVAGMLGIPVLLVVDEHSQQPGILEAETLRWIQASLSACVHIYSSRSAWSVDGVLLPPVIDIGSLGDDLALLTQRAQPEYLYDYSIYEFCERDQPLLVSMQRGDVRHFDGCSRVLDLACGAGIFLDCLRRSGIPARGVERNPKVAQYGREMGLDIVTEDALTYLEHAETGFDGIYCSHFVEHLTVQAVQQTLELIAKRLVSGGVLVLVFPDPESIRTQLLGFWRDPEHVRFYHPDLIVSMASTVGLELAWSSYIEQPHQIVPFAAAPPPITKAERFPRLLRPASTFGDSLVDRVLRKFGLVSERRLRNLEERLLQWSDALEQHANALVETGNLLEKRTDDLWNVNLTWAWSDNVTLRFRKTGC